MKFVKAGVLALAAALSMGAAIAQEPVDPQPAQPPDVAKQMMAEGVVLIDVREPNEFAEGHVQGAVNVPLSTFKPGMKLEAVPNLESKVLVQCKSGVRAEKAAKILVESGYKHVYNAYGTSQWKFGLVK